MINGLTIALGDRKLGVLVGVFFAAMIGTSLNLTTHMGFAVLAFIKKFVATTRPRLIGCCNTGSVGGFRRLVFGISRCSLFVLTVVNIPMLVRVSCILSL